MLTSVVNIHRPFVIFFLAFFWLLSRYVSLIHILLGGRYHICVYLLLSAANLLSCFRCVLDFSLSFICCIYFSLLIFSFFVFIIELTLFNTLANSGTVFLIVIHKHFGGSCIGWRVWIWVGQQRLNGGKNTGNIIYR